MSSGPEMPEFVVTLLSNLPDQWDIELWTRILMRGYESAFGYKGEFTYENAGVLGRGNEVQTQHRNATAMGGKDFILANQGEIQNILPPTIEFLYDERDVEGEIEEANLQRAKADVITSISNWVEVSPAGQQSRIPTAQLLQLAAENDVVPDDWAVGEEDVTATDEEEVEQPNELSERVQRAMQAFPDEPIVRYEWPRDRTRIVRVPRRRSFYFPKVLHRSVGEVVKSYEDSLTNLVYNAWNRIGNKLTAPAVMQTAFRTEHKRLVNRVGPEAYGEGLREGGVAIEEMDASDKTAISEWVSAQASFVNDFARAVVEAGADEAQRPAILTRLAQWVRSASDLGNTGYLSTKKNRPAIWHLGPTETHCKTCVGLDGKRHRVSWFLERGYLPHVPGNTVLACNGYGHCFISDAVTGERIEV
jgi:hypothetical protein